MPAEKPPGAARASPTPARTATPVSRGARPVPAGGLLHPVPLLAMALLVVNDHLLKGWGPGWLTGKLSDGAGMVFFPLLLQAAAEWGLARTGRAWGPSRRALVVAAVATGLVFALVQLWPPMTALYRWGLGLLQWPARAALGWARGASVALLPAAATPDPTDLLAVPFVLVAVACGWRRGRDQA